MQQSIVQQRGNITLPEFTGERVYMREFYQHEGLPAGLLSSVSETFDTDTVFTTDSDFLIFITDKLVLEGLLVTESSEGVARFLLAEPTVDL